MVDSKYIYALRFSLLNRVYDPLVRLTVRELIFKKALIEQANFKPHQRVLDLGCGTGTLAIMIKRIHSRTEVYGIDGDSEVIGIARRKASKNCADVTFDRGMSSEMFYPDGSFDLVVSSLFFHHLTREDKEKTLREAHRVLKDGGELHIADWGLPDNCLMAVASRSITLLDGRETTEDNFEGHLVTIISGAEFTDVWETLHFNTLFGTIRLLKARK